MNRSRKDERGITLVTMALALVGLLAVAGLAVDGGFAYASRRQVQNAADSSSLAGARVLNLRLMNKSTTSSIHQAALDEALANGGDSASFVCRLVNVSQGDLGACPTTTSGTLPAGAAGVHATIAKTSDTFLMQVVGQDDYTARADAIAQVQKVLGGNAPFLVCGNAVGHNPPMLIPDGSGGWTVNSAAIYLSPGVGNQTQYNIWGNAIKQQGRDCGNPSSSFRGEADQNAGPFDLPGWWEGEQGNKNGPTLRLLNSGNVCDANYNLGCRVVLPLCSHGNGQSGNGFEAYCLEFGLFQVSFVDNHDMRAYFLGPATITGGVQGGGLPDPNGARIVQLSK